MSYVLVRTDGAFVSDPQTNGTGSSYTGLLQKAKIFSSKETAERDRCPGSETVMRVEDCFQ